MFTHCLKEREDLNGFYRLQASIMDRDLFAISEGGFLVGKNYDLKSGIRLTANLIDTNDDFFIDLNHTQFEPGKTYYYRAFINNGVKETGRKSSQIQSAQFGGSECLVCKNGRS